MNEVLKVIKERRSTRAFSDRKVNKSDLEIIVEAGQYAPSAMNSQAWHFTVVTNETALKCTDGDNAKPDEDFSCFYKAPAFIIVSCEPHASPYAEADCSCALQNMFLAAHSLGLGTCWINRLTHISFAPEMRALLTEMGVPNGNKVYGCAAVGYIQIPTPVRERKEHTVNFVE